MLYANRVECMRLTPLFGRYLQLVAAIGKEVGSQDFAAYQVFHNRKLFKSEFQPRAFAYAIRRPGMYILMCVCVCICAGLSVLYCLVLISSLQVTAQKACSRSKTLLIMFIRNYFTMLPVYCFLFIP